MYYLIFGLFLLRLDYYLRKIKFTDIKIYESKYLDISVNTVHNHTFNLKKALISNCVISLYLLYYQSLNQYILSILMAAGLNCYDKYQNKHVGDYLYTKIYFYKSTENIADLMIIFNNVLLFRNIFILRLLRSRS